MELILLPVSLGEAMDKLTILEIKMEKISDSRRTDCEKEYQLLADKIDPYRKQFAYYYRILKEINLSLWETQDHFHGRNVSPEEGAAMCRLILNENDRRFRVKAKINVASGSPLREQKGYGEKLAFLNAPRERDVMTWLNGAIRFLATAYDKVLVACSSRDEAELRAIYEDDPCIELRVIGDESGTAPLIDLPDDLVTRSEITVFSCGPGAGSGKVSDLPELFYDELKLGRNIRTEYFHAPSRAAEAPAV